jgi:glycosyl hydrolase family 26
MRIAQRATSTSRARSRLTALIGGVFATTLITAMIGDAALAYPPVLVPERGAYLGTWVAARSGESGQDPIERVEDSIGRTFAIDHRYYRWNQSLPTEYDEASYRAGRLPFLSWKPMRTDGSIVPWAAITDGLHDDWIVEQARRFKAFGAPTYLTFHHEPEDDGQFGTPAEFASAFRHVVQVFRQQRVRNVAFVWTMMSWTFDERSGKDPMDWYPGDRSVDIVGTDGYNWYPLRSGAPWDSFRDVIAPTMDFAAGRKKPVFVVEFGVMEDPAVANRKANWYRKLAATAKRWPRLKGLIYFDEIKDGFPWITDSSTESLDGYADMADSRWLSVMPRLS